MLRSIKVRDYMTTHLLTFRPDTDLYRAIGLLLEHRLSAAPVVDEAGQLLGLLAETDCLRGILSGAYFEQTGGLVGSCMNSQVDTVSPDASVIEVAERFLQGGHRHLPVVEAGRLLGELGSHEVLLAVKEFAQHDRGHVDHG
ncbi:CBS domain-containing protein [Aquipseudomonas alcaligenes]|uniref:CBS domain-containing protein n=1 Tax=Aquipseudomonas alcaligenes TaxID=43263 RepID=UPI001F269A29|nr:CBS domain-containing protein [Pseudomonas alcaligenes]